MSQDDAVAPVGVCPSCSSDIDAADVNMAEGVAICRACNQLTRVSALLAARERAELSAKATAEPPDGAWASDDGVTVRVGATTRSIAGALGLLFFTLFWNGIVSVFVSIVLASTLRHAGVTIPNWFPAPTMNGQAMSLGMTMFLWLFLTPFLLVGLGVFVAFLSALGGRVEVTADRERGTIFTGVGPIGWRRRFERGSVRDVRLEVSDAGVGRNARSQTSIVLEADKALRFGSQLSEERRRFVAGALARALLRSA